MSFALLKQFYRDFPVPPGLQPLAPLISAARHYRSTGEMILPKDARKIFGPDRGASFRLPDDRPAAVEDPESCVLLWDSERGQTGLAGMRGFLMAVRLPIHVLPLAGQDAETVRRQIEELQHGGCTIQLVWGALGDFRILRDTPPDNVIGKTVPVGWHFQSLSTGFQQTAVGDRNPLLLQLQPAAFTHVLTALELVAYTEGHR
jgi:hypothetical protein